ncbi:ABC transporter protein [Mycena indigotica]|uniref:ABC transporter protein n=1 Tax=Mycena indigotica TaxID=2126181 RepID=A0A8H6W622_9AGAR|nr:ABC transporter protein [Mycena indigotica]KAF7307139.1 ABC transporter protein [Mycena indigotica]
MRLLLLSLCVGLALAHPMHNAPGLGDIFGDDTFDDSPIDTSTEVFPRPPRLPPIATNEGPGFVDLLPTTTAGKRIKSSSTAASVGSASLAAINTLLSSTTSLASTPTTTIPLDYTPLLPVVPPTETPGDTSTTSSAAAQWKIIGVTTVGIAVVAGFLLCILYYDALWGCMLAMVGKKKRKNKGTEDLVPDWARGEWEYKIASEDGHRYPTMASLESMAKNLKSPNPDPHSLVPSRLPSIYIPKLEPHPLEPLFRRPSVVQHPILLSPNLQR